MCLCYKSHSGAGGKFGRPPGPVCDRAAPADGPVTTAKNSGVPSALNAVAAAVGVMDQRFQSLGIEGVNRKKAPRCSHVERRKHHE